MPVTYKIIGGLRAGELIAPNAPGMQKPVDASPIAPSDRSPLAKAARKQDKADRSYDLRPVTFEFPDEPSITVYAPEGTSDDEVLRELGLSRSQRSAPEHAVLEDTVNMYEKP